PVSDRWLDLIGHRAPRWIPAPPREDGSPNLLSVVHVPLSAMLSHNPSRLQVEPESVEGAGKVRLVAELGQREDEVGSLRHGKKRRKPFRPPSVTLSSGPLLPPDAAFALRSSIRQPLPEVTHPAWSSAERDIRALLAADAS